MHEWSAEVTVDRDLAYRLIAGQFDLEPADLRLLSEGWDNTVWLVDQRWVFRFPRRAVVIAGIEREMALLPRLAPLVPLPIPTPVFFGRPADGYPWPFFGAALIPGREMADAACSEADRCRLARPLADFLRALHDGATAAAIDPTGELPGDPMGRGDMQLRVPRTAERLAEVERLGLWRAPGNVHDVLDAARGLGAPEPSTLVHGDLHIRHLLVDDDCGAAGVIDWIDICRGDPAIDLPLFWSLLPAAGRAEFLDAYGSVTDAQAAARPRAGAVPERDARRLRPPRGNGRSGARSDRRAREDSGGLRGWLSAQRWRGDEGPVPAPVKAGCRDGAAHQRRAAESRKRTCLVQAPGARSQRPTEAPLGVPVASGA